MKNKETCHICLCEKRNINQKKSCINDDCTGYICSSCWYDIHNNSIDVCPLCREPIKYTLTQKIFNIKKNVKNVFKNIIIYLAFYSMGGCSFITFKYIFKDITIENYITNDFEDIILSLFIFPILGFIIWYTCILIIAKIVFLNVSNTYSESESESESDSESESEVDYFDNVLIIS
mgnify:CR=1 FL=1